MVMLRGRVNGELTLKSLIAWVKSHPIAFSIIFAAPNSYIFGFFHLSLVSGVEVIDQIAISEAFFYITVHFSICIIFFKFSRLPIQHYYAIMHSFYTEVQYNKYSQKKKDIDHIVGEKKLTENHYMPRSLLFIILIIYLHTPVWKISYVDQYESKLWVMMVLFLILIITIMFEYLHLISYNIRNDGENFSDFTSQNKEKIYPSICLSIVIFSFVLDLPDL
jgi:hypothetical protein